MRGSISKAASLEQMQAKVQATYGSHRQAWHPDKPPLFLQEAAHLLSLMSAVAFSTLRNDLEQAYSPLITFTPGAPFPHVDPDAYTADVRRDWTTTNSRPLIILRYISGWSRTVKDRTLYNAARPFRVIGGVSDSEIELLQAARGPLAKVALVSMWLQEFITREYLAGSTGNVATPVLSRLYQFVSDGMVGYNQARKVRLWLLLGREKRIFVILTCHSLERLPTFHFLLRTPVRLWLTLGERRGSSSFSPSIPWLLRIRNHIVIRLCGGCPDAVSYAIFRVESVIWFCVEFDHGNVLCWTARGRPRVGEPFPKRPQRRSIEQLSRAIQ
jgi:hypothetical protein